MPDSGTAAEPRWMEPRGLIVMLAVTSMVWRFPCDELHGLSSFHCPADAE